MSDSHFQQAATDPKGLEQALLGNPYPYAKFVKNPSQMGMSGNGGMDVLANDIEGIMSYVQILIEGTGNASATGQPLGNKYFVPIQGLTCKPSGKVKCMDINGNVLNPCPGLDKDGNAPRSIYINNVPTGNIPFVSSATGVDFTQFRGLVPGIMQSAEALNPLALLGGFMQGANPPCSYVTMETIGDDNVKRNQGAWVADAELSGMDPCEFGKPYNGNPLTGEPCTETLVGGRGEPHQLGPGGVQRKRVSVNRAATLLPTPEEWIAGGVTALLAIGVLRMME